MKQIILPKKIIQSEKVLNAKALKVKKPLQVVLRGDAEWINSNAVILGKGHVILDFGKEMNGGIRLLMGEYKGENNLDLSKPNIRIRFGESLTETCYNLGEKGITGDHGLRDITVCAPNYSNLTFGDTGFRFVRIDFLQDAKLVIQNVFCENYILNKKAVYNYNGSDRLVKNIFQTAKRTVDLCASGDYVWDGVKRDRLVWIGDMHPEMLSLVTLYGKTRAVERSLDFVREQTPLNLWMNGISSYSMWWLITVCDYYLLTGEKDFIDRQMDYIEGLIDKFDSCVDDEGKMNYGWLFVDWSSCGSGEEDVGVRLINIMAVKRAIALFNRFGKDTSKAEKVIKKLYKGNLHVEKKKQIIGLKYMAEGSITDYEYQRLIEGGAKGLSTFMSYYILKAIASKNVQKAIDIMKEYYGAMLSIGATTFFEDFNIEWIKNCARIDKFPKKGQLDFHGDFGDHCYVGFRHSLCHGWSSGVIKFIKEYQDYLK